jgi:hypothetical protein
MLILDFEACLQAERLRDHLGEVLLHAYALKQQACRIIYTSHAR